MILDIHSHILPGIDDGAKNFEESIKLLQMMKNQGVDIVVATPHLDISEPNALEKRDEVISQYKKLCEMASGKKLPEIYLGYELVFRYGMSENPNLDKFTIAGTNKILIELPFGRITNKIIAEIEEIAYARRLTPVLAHLERYIQYEGVDKIYDAVLNGDVEAQISADVVDGFWDRMFASRLIKKDVFTYFGSDAHSVEKRPPMVDRFMKFAKKYHKSFLKKTNEASKKLYMDMKKPTE